jgi:hypothetical protein
MRHTSPTTQLMALIATLGSALLVNSRLLAADQTAPATAKPNAFHLPAIQDVRTPPHAVLGLGVSAAQPSPQRPAATIEKLKELGAQLRRALDISVDLLSGNETDFLSRNKTALLSGNKPEILSGNKPEVLSGNKAAMLSGNKPEILSGNKPEILSGNKPTVLSGNTTPILSGNSFLSNIKIEIHITNSGNGAGAPPFAQPMMNPANARGPVRFTPTQPSMQPSLQPTPIPAR